MQLLLLDQLIGNPIGGGMPIMKILTRVQAFLLCLSFGLSAHAQHEISLGEIWRPDRLNTVAKTIQISAVVSKKSLWTKNEIQDRIHRANRVLASCDIQIDAVFFQDWNPVQPKIRVDDLNDGSLFFDGMSEAATKTVTTTDLNLYYFETYLEPFTSGPALPLAVYSSSSTRPHLDNTAWFPYYSHQRLLKSADEQYSEEAHELGHLLLQQGHDFSDEPNIMAHSSDLRSETFSPEQCQRIRQSELVDETNPRGIDLSLGVLKSLFAYHFFSYGHEHYMNNYCLRNSLNFRAKAIAFARGGARENTLVEDLRRKPSNIDSSNSTSIKNFNVVLVRNLNTQLSIFPLVQRYGASKWQFHAFVVIDGLVYDADFSDRPTVLPLDEYLFKMFGPEQTLQLEFALAPDHWTGTPTMDDIDELFRLGSSHSTLTGLQIMNRQALL